MIMSQADIQIMEERGAPLLGKAEGLSENFVRKRKIGRGKNKENGKDDGRKEECGKIRQRFCKGSELSRKKTEGSQK